MSASDQPVQQVLLLHGNRQTGQLLLGRVSKLRKALEKNGLELLAPDAPFPYSSMMGDKEDDADDDGLMRTWWHREGNHYYGLERVLNDLAELWSTSGRLVGICGFSQGARLAHLIATCHERQPEFYFTGLRFVVMVAGYDAPLPPEVNMFVPPVESSTLSELRHKMQTPSLHVFGYRDNLIMADQSIAVSSQYANPVMHGHEGGHHVPMRAENVRAYVDFIMNALDPDASRSAKEEGSTETGRFGLEDQLLQMNSASLNTDSTADYERPTNEPVIVPDEETAQTQIEEVEALSAIFPDEFTLLSKADGTGTDNVVYEHPIVYRIDLPPSEDGVWPPHPVSVRVKYAHNYPIQSPPLLTLEQNDNDVFQFSIAQNNAVLQAMKEAAEAEEGMPCVMSCIYAAREFFESGAMATIVSSADDEVVEPDSEQVDAGDSESENDQELGSSTRSVQICAIEKIERAKLKGLEVAASVLKRSTLAGHEDTAGPSLGGKGGSWTYTIGLVGKPSAGKSTFFNAATAFARQRNDPDNALGGAAMAPHPFTTIDPNVGYCLVPAPSGSCPEEDYNGDDLTIGSSHGRDHLGRRLLPVLLKDVAGLVPGAYQGRGRGNAFLNDLCDGDVLIHVVDVSGTADAEGNVAGQLVHPLKDLSWIYNELTEWVYTNLMLKWDIVVRRGRSKLHDMFSGYGQPRAATSDILDAVEKYLEHEEHRHQALDHLDAWDNSDIYFLVSAFLGARFPMALALNKYDLSSSKQHVEDIQAALPVHGAHVGVPMSAKSEMTFIRNRTEAALGVAHNNRSDRDGDIPSGIWHCLQSATTLREPVIVFPVSDMSTYAPLPGMSKRATEDPSLPSIGMITCLEAAGGSLPTNWDSERHIYAATAKSSSVALRDALVMKPGSTVEDVFLVLKRRGALEGEFVRAEGAGGIGEKPKLVPKFDVVGKETRILKIMTNKRTAWQSKE